MPSTLAWVAAGMKEAWCLATNRTDLSPNEIVELYGKRFTIEETFRDHLKVNTVKRRTHSLFRQDCYWYSALPNLRDERLQPLMEAFGKIVSEHELSREMLGVI